MSDRIAGIELNCSLEFSLGRRIVPIEPQSNLSQRTMSSRDRVIQLNCFQCRGPGFWESLLGREFAVQNQVTIAVGQPGVSLGITRVVLNSLVEVLDGLFRFFFCKCVSVVRSLEISLMSFRLDPTCGCQARLLLWRQLDTNLTRDRPGDLALKCQYVTQIALIALGPYLTIGWRV